jgi:hypothetical protein
MRISHSRHLLAMLGSVPVGNVERSTQVIKCAVVRQHHELSQRGAKPYAMETLWKQSAAVRTIHNKGALITS